MEPLRNTATTRWFDERSDRLLRKRRARQDDIVRRPRLSEEDPPERGAFNLYIELGRASSEDVRRILSALNELDFAAGGMGFTFTLPEERSMPRSGLRLPEH